MPRSSRSPRHLRLRQLLVDERLAAGLTQEDVAAKLKRPQSFVSKYESGERRLDVVEFLEVCEALGIAGPRVLELSCRLSDQAGAIDVAAVPGRQDLWTARRG